MELDNRKKSAILAVIVIVLLLSGLGSCLGGSDSDRSSGSSKKSKQCEVCYRTFTDSSNRKSIAYRNMCEKCYENFKWTKKALESIGY